MAPVKRGSLLVIAFAATALLIGGASAQQARLEEITVVRLCVPVDVDQAVCDATFNATLNSAINTQNVYFKCRVGMNAPTCAEMVASGQADIVKAGGDEIYSAYTQFGLFPFASEDYNNGPAGVEYNPVMLVKKSFCDAYTPGAGFMALKGKGLCATGYRKTAGWAVPVGALMNSIPSQFTASITPNNDNPNVKNDAEAVAGFFSKVCAPRFIPAGPYIDPVTGAADRWKEGLCTGCIVSQADNTFCYDNRPAKGKDLYADYAGALKCLQDGAGDVAFLKHATPQELIPTAQQSDYRLFCPNSPSGPCTTIGNWASCSYGQVRAHSFMGRPGWDAGSAISAPWVAALNAVSGNTTARTPLTSLSVFTSDALAVAQNSPVGFSFADWYGRDTMQAIASYRSLDRTVGLPTTPVVAPLDFPATTPVIRVCIPADVNAIAAGIAFNASLNLKASLQRLNVYFEPKVGYNVGGCQQLIRDGNADIVKLGSSDMFDAFSDYGGLRPYAAEDFLQGLPASIEYYSVAMVTKQFCDANPTSYSALKGKKLCSTGYRKSAGWSVPVGVLYNNEPSFASSYTDNANVTNDADAVASFFGPVCAPRFTAAGPFTDPASGRTDKWNGLCSLCDQSQPATSFCYENAGATNAAGLTLGRDRYTDYTGALQCMQDGVADVSFTKESTPLTLSASDQQKYRLFCPGATGSACKQLSEWSQCNLGFVRAHGLVGRPNWNVPGTQTWTDAVNAFAAVAADAVTRGRLVPLSVMTADARAFETITVPFSTWFGADLSAVFTAMRTLSSRSLTSAPVSVKAGATTIRVCIPADVSPSAAGTAFNTSLNLKASAMNVGVYFEPKVGFNIRGCQQMIRDGNADIVKIGSSDMFDAFSDYGRLRPYAAEDFQQGLPAGIEYYSVAMVTKQFCDANPTSYSALKGKKLCSTGYRKSAGWSVPVGVLYNKEPSFTQGVTDNAAVTNDADAVASFFGPVCAPRFTAAGPYTDPASGRTDKWDGLCSLCDKSQPASNFCYENAGAKNAAGLTLGRDRYTDYTGALQCMQDGVADVSFTKESTPLTLSASDQQKYRLFCPEATGSPCKQLSEWSQCNLGLVRAHGLVGRPDWNVPGTQTWTDAVNVFSAVAADSASRARLVPLSVLTADARALDMISTDFPTWFGPTLSGVFTAMRTLSARSFPVPAPSNDETVLDPGAIAGIIVAIAVGGSLLGCALYKLSLRVRGAKYVLERDFNDATRGENIKNEAQVPLPSSGV